MVFIQAHLCGPYIASMGLQMPGIYAEANNVRAYLASAVEATDDQVSQAIADAAIEVDAGVGPGYPADEDQGWKFPDLPDTPRLITLLTVWFAVSYVVGIKQVQSKDSRQPSNEKKFRDRAEAKLKQLRAGELSIAADDDGTDDKIGGLVVDGPDEIFTAEVLAKY